MIYFKDRGDRLDAISIRHGRQDIDGYGRNVGDKTENGGKTPNSCFRVEIGKVVFSVMERPS
ncbi:hypothetical protein [Sphingobium sp. YG1]|uniref:hypothetical protein n=1 Tax=Sphingobium sp. YG1 TaxID=2082188 RepID=UPI0011AE3ECA|nr:hypothetical protein [Sphingobium sp. YG1]